MSTRRHLVVSATRAEAAYVPRGVPLVVTGVGKTAAAAAVTEALVQGPRDGLVVLAIGTAGALRPGLAGLFEPSRVVNHDISAAALAAVGVPTEDELDVPGGDGTVLATGDVFVTDPVVRDRLAQRAHLVDMEGFAVVYACRRLGVEVHLAKHVTDAADAGALDWPDVVDASARVLGGWLGQRLDA